MGQAFLEVLKLARQMGVLKVGTVSVDGTHLRANAAKRRSVRHDRAEDLERQLQQEIAGLMQKAERMDQEESDDGQSLPQTIASRQKLKAQLQRAREELQRRARAKAAAERAEYEAKVAARQQRVKRGGRGCGRPPKPAEDSAVPQPDDRINLTDPDSRALRKSVHGESQQAYNAQAVVDADGSMLMLGTRVIQTSVDFGQLEAAVDQVDRSLGKVQRVVADAGYVEGDSFDRLETRGIDVCVAVTRETFRNDPYDLQGHARGIRGMRGIRGTKPPRLLRDPRMLRMNQKMKTPEARRHYAKRKQTVEPVLGIIKSVMGFRQFLLRGLKKVTGEWSLVALAYNFKRLARLRPPLAN